MKTTSRINKRNQILLIWAVGLIAAFSSTSFAALGGGDKEAPAPRSNGQQVNGRGGGQDSGGSSCLPNAQAMDLNVDETGLEDEDVKLVMTDRGPVVRIGNTQIATDPNEANDPKDKSQKEKKFGWCVQSQEFAKSVLQNANQGNQFVCNSTGTMTQKDGQWYSPKFKIPTKNGSDVSAQIVQKKDKDDNIIDSRIIISSTGKKNMIVLKEHYDKSGENKVKGNFSIAAVSKDRCSNADSSTCDNKEAGTLKFPIEGTLKTQSSSNDADSEGGKFQSCSVGTDNMGPKNKNETAASPKIDLVGSCILYRGATVPFVGEHQEKCNTANDQDGGTVLQNNGAKSAGRS